MNMQIPYCVSYSFPYYYKTKIKKMHGGSTAHCRASLYTKQVLIARWCGIWQSWFWYGSLVLFNWSVTKLELNCRVQTKQRQRWLQVTQFHSKKQKRYLQKLGGKKSLKLHFTEFQYKERTSNIQSCVKWFLPD